MHHRRIRVHLADNQSIFIKGLQLAFEKYPRIQVVGVSSTCDHLLEMISLMQADVVVMDISLPNSITTVTQLRNLYPDTKVIILSQHEEESLIVDVLKAGASGYMLKKEDQHFILKGIEEVFEGNAYYSTKVLGKINCIFSEQHYRKSRCNSKFSDQEKEIIKHLCKEMTNKEISEKLFLSIRTVEGYRLRIMQKINAKSTAGIVIYAIQNGLFKMQWKVDKLKMQTT